MKLKNDKQRELELIEKTSNEGFGSVYERIILRRFFKQLMQRYQFSSVFELGTKYTKGYDNLVFADKGKKIQATPADLVWNFALVQQKSILLKQMKSRANKYVLVFTPNIFNYGTIPHVGFHWLIRKPCQHAESGSVSLRTEMGLRNFFKKEGLEVLESGGIDIPWWPDTAFSFKEVKKELGLASKAKTKAKAKVKTAEVWEKIEKASWIETSRLPKLVKLPFVHHNFVLGKV
ncbi:hypothetical protein ACFL18_02030 [Patescibacteria group bacterium]